MCDRLNQLHEEAHRVGPFRFTQFNHSRFNPFNFPAFRPSVDECSPSRVSRALGEGESETAGLRPSSKNANLLVWLVFDRLFP